MDNEIIVSKSNELVAKSSIDWQKLIDAFVLQQDVKKSSRKLYQRTLRRYFDWIDETGKDVSILQCSDIREYKDYLIDKGLSNLTVGSYLVIVRKLYVWLDVNGIYKDIAKGIKLPKRKQAFKKQHLTVQKSKELIKYYKGKSLRNYAIINLLLRTGLRTIEVVRLNIEDITFKGGQRILQIWGKGRDTKDDFVILSDKTYKILKDYLDTRDNLLQGSPLFVSESRQNKGQRLTTRTISGICKEALQAIGLDGKEFTAHSLRHTTAVHILKQTKSIEAVQEVLRHSSSDTSRIYTESIREEERLANATEKILDKIF